MQSFCESSDFWQFNRSRYNGFLTALFIVLTHQVFQADSINFSEVKAFGFHPNPRVESMIPRPYIYHTLKSRDITSPHGLRRNIDVFRRRRVDISKPKISVNEYGSETKPHKKEVDSTLDDLLEVLGPHLFLVPFLLKVLPFAIPALPLSYILSRHAPATIPEIIMQIMEYSTQINELLFMQQESNTAVGGHEG